MVKESCVVGCWFFFFSSRRRHTRLTCDWSSDVCSSDLTNKYYGRVGDSPIIGAGTYANDSSCGVSGTGTGEYFIRLDLAKTISDLMLYKGMLLAQAADQLRSEERRVGKECRSRWSPDE